MTVKKKHLFMLKQVNELSMNEVVVDKSNNQNPIPALPSELVSEAVENEEQLFISVLYIKQSDSNALLSSKDAQLVDKTCQYLTKNLCTKQTLNGISCAVGSNRTNLSASFKKVLGVGVFQWLRNQRLQKAQYLLCHSHLSIQDISIEVGYDNNANFSTAYKRLYGISPSQFRRLNVSVS